MTDTIKQIKKINRGDPEQKKGKTQRAVKSCLMCLASYCDEHLEQPYQKADINSHLIQDGLKDGLCKQHEKIIQFFFLTNQAHNCRICFDSGPHPLLYVNKIKKKDALSLEMSTLTSDVKGSSENVFNTVKLEVEKTEEKKIPEESDNESHYMKLKDNPNEVYSTVNKPEDQLPDKKEEEKSSENEPQYMKLKENYSEIYAAANTAEDPLLVKKQKEKSSAGKASYNSVCFYKWTTISLAVLCCVFLLIIIGLGVQYYNIRNEPCIDVSQNYTEPTICKTVEHPHISSISTRLTVLLKNMLNGSNLPRYCNGEICEFCPNGWTYYNHKCYFFSKNMLNWSSSQEHCKLTGGSLVIIQDEKEQDYITQETKRIGGFIFWIGLSKNRTTEEWSWEGDTKLKEGYWKDSSSSHERLCAAIHPQVQNLNNWRKSMCYIVSRRICEIEALPM
uniref:Oxidized low-density lipoprotein receptor 1-like n=1 Tax=Erpetoichthys calabaricus TaxID=27687 RepID=A0A8C4SAJ6_ERPCA